MVDAIQLLFHFDDFKLPAASHFKLKPGHANCCSTLFKCQMTSGSCRRLGCAVPVLYFPSAPFTQRPYIPSP